jgi:hypothetical protein
MTSFGIVLLFCLVALIAACLVNVFVGLLSGERQEDTGRVWLDILLRVFGLGRLGFIGRMLNYAEGVWPRRILYAVGGISILLLLIEGCRD